MSVLDEVKEIKKIIEKCEAGCLEEAKVLLRATIWLSSTLLYPL